MPGLGDILASALPFFTGSREGSFTNEETNRRKAELRKQREEDAYRANYPGQVMTQGKSTSPLGDIIASSLEKIGLGGQGAHDFGQKVENVADVTPYGTMKKVGQGDLAGAAEDLVGGGGSDLASIFMPATKKLTRAFHGSPHSFDRFDLSKLGTGEGNQAFGHGLYFAENPRVAEDYRDRLSPPKATFTDPATGQPWNWYPSTDPATTYNRLGLTKEHGGYVRWLLNEMQNSGMNVEQTLELPHIKRFYQSSPSFRIAADALKANRATMTGKGNIYEVDIEGDPNSFLHWDKPLAEQNVWEKLHPEVRNVVDDVMDNRGMNAMSDALDDYKGSHLYKALKHYDVNEALPAELPGSSWMTGDTTEAQHTSAYLNELGVPGIRFLDQGSRGRDIGEGSHNIVTFSDKIINVVKKNGIAAALTAGLITESQAAQLREQGYE